MTYRSAVSLAGLQQSIRKCLKVQVQSIKSTNTFLWSYFCSFIVENELSALTHLLFKKEKCRVQLQQLHELCWTQ